VLQFHVKRPHGRGRQAGAQLPVPAAKNVAGIQTVCWDQRYDAIPTAAPAGGPGAAAAMGGGGRGGAGGGAGGGGGRGGAAQTAPVPDVPQPIPAAGYKPENPCAGGGGGGGFGGFGGGGANAGPYVGPGEYTVALVAGDRTFGSQRMRIIQDPEVRMTAPERARYQAILVDLHTLQGRAAPVAAGLTALQAQIDSVVVRTEASAAPASVKAQVATLKRDLEAVRPKFGVAAGGPGGPGGGLAAFAGGGGRGGPAVDPANVYARAGTLKQAIGGIWELPSAALVAQYDELRVALPRAVTDGEKVLEAARRASSALAAHGVTLTVPATIR
jgi:hypothetical protein